MNDHEETKAEHTADQQGRLEAIVSWLLYQAKMLRYRPRLFWHRAYIRRDEFHQSLDLDVSAILDMANDDRERYLDDLVRRRNEAHERDLDS